LGATGTTDAITPLKGFACVVPANITVDVSGPLNNGPINYSVTKASDGTNIIGNPYPSPISWSAFRSHNTNLQTTYKAFVTTGGYGGSYGDYNITTGLGTNGVGNIIASSQAFLVTANAAGAIQALNTDRTLDLNPTFFSQPVITNDVLRMELVKNNAHDEIVVFFAPGLSTDNFEVETDAKKMIPFSTTQSFLYSKAGNKQLSMNGLGAFNTDKVVPLGIKVSTSGIHEIRATDLSSFQSSAMIYLKDVESGTVQDLRTNPVYEVNLTAGNYENRFFIQFTPAVMLNSENATCLGNDGKIMLSYNSNSSVNMLIRNEAGNVVSNINNFNGQHTFSNLLVGNYEVIYTHANGFESIDYVTIGGSLPIGLQALSSASQAATGQQIIFSSTGNAVNTTWNFGDGATAVGNNVSHVFNNAGHYVVTATASNGICDETKELEVEILSTTGIELVTLQSVQWLVNNQQVTVKFNTALADHASIELIDLAGKQVYSNTISKGQLQHNIVTTKFAEGIYLAKITSNNQVSVKKIVVSK
jgi:hypothetical protein